MGKERKVTRKKRLSQYYTNRDIAEALITAIPTKKAKTIIDLSAGEGALLITARDKYKEAKLYGVDIDEENCNKFSTLQNTTSLCLDSTLPCTLEKIKLLQKKFDVVIGNPPFFQNEHTDFTRSVFLKWSLNFTGKYYRAEILFLILSLELLKSSGSCGIVVPDTIISGEKFTRLREKIVSSFKFIKIIELDNRSFLGTEARTHILIVSNDESIPSSIVTGKSKISSEIELSKDCFILRADYQYNSFKYKDSKITIENSGVRVLRGKVSKSKDSDLLGSIIHSSSFYDNYSFFDNDREIEENAAVIQAVKGDVVVPRVGTRCLGKVGIIRSGSFTITDCVFVIKASEHKCGDMIVRTLKSKFGVEWIKSISKGIGAQYITLNDIRKLPLR